MRKKIIFLVILLFILTGCTKIDTYNNDYGKTVDDVLVYKNNYVNNASIGYKYYLPKGIKVMVNKDYNQIFKCLDNYMYLYVDIVSYYYKNNLNLNENKNHYYYNNIGDKGYIMVDDMNSKYFVKIVYNYAKMEFYSDYDDLNTMIIYSMIILNSIDYNDITIESILNNSSVSSSEINYEIKGPNNDSSFSQYLEEYIDDEEEELLPVE